VSPTTAEHVRDELGDRVDLVLDGGPCTVGIESTVLDLTGEVPTILRPGGVSKKQVEFILGTVNDRANAASDAQETRSPGQQPVHYSPRTPAVRFETSQRGLIHPQTEAQSNGIVVLSPLRIFKKWGPIIAMPNDPPEYAKHLYAVLRELDEMRLRTIYIEMPPEKPEWIAIRDRLRKATVPL
jgi:L-threonylcarbamoyladenylate synthase